MSVSDYVACSAGAEAADWAVGMCVLEYSWDSCVDSVLSCSVEISVSSASRYCESAEAWDVASECD